MTDRGWQPRTEAELVADQLAGLDAWNEAQRRIRTQVAQSRALSREMQLDLRRSMQARRSEQQALLARAALQLEQSLHPAAQAAPRAVLAHRSEWFRGKVAGRLRERGVTVVASVGDGAEAAGTVVVEQPEVVLVEDRLPTLSGREVLERVRRFAPRSIVAVQLEDNGEMENFFADGARAVFTRRIPPDEVADALVRCLFARPRLTLVGQQEQARSVSKQGGNTL